LVEGLSELDRAKRKIVLKKKITLTLLDTWTTSKNEI